MKNVSNKIMAETIIKIIGVVSNSLTIVASGIAIYLFFWKRETVSKLFKMLMNYSYQLTLSELRGKLDRLNDLNVNEPTHKEEIINIFNEIVGQLRGNKNLAAECSGCLKKLSAMAESPDKLSEPRKRSVVSELRESLRHTDIKSCDDLVK